MASGMSVPILLRSKCREVRRRQTGGHAAEGRADGRRVKLEQRGDCRGGDDSDEEARPFRQVSPEAKHDREGNRRDGDGDEIRTAEIVPDGRQLGHEIGGHGDFEAEQILDLGGEDRNGDAGGEADDDRVGDVFDEGAEAEETKADEDEAGHDGRHQEAVIALAVDDVEDDDDEGRGRAADLEAAAAESGDDEAGDD